MRTSIVLVLLCAVSLLACPPTQVGKNACEGISMPAIPPGTGSLTMCVLPSECREDTMTTYMDSSICSDKSKASCPAGAAACSNACVGTVVSSGLKASNCSWDRNSECLTSSGDKGGKCTCDWTVPAGSSIQCGCGCK